MRLKNITPIEPKPSRCIEVDAPDKLFAAGGENGAAIASHNSVVQRNIILGCILRPDSWRFLGIDLKKVELSSFRAYSNVVLGIATTLEDALTVLRFAQETMMKRYAELEQLGLNNFLDLPEKGQALLVMVDEAGELLSPAGVKALAESTPILTPGGPVLLKDLEVGATVLNSNSEAVEVVNKYTPIDQGRFKLRISRDEDGATEEFVAGSEHYWVAYLEGPDGTIVGPETVDTQWLYDFKQEQLAKPESERSTVKFKKYE